MTDTPDTSPNLGLPFYQTKLNEFEVQHNEALLVLDALAMLAVIDRDLSAPPSAPALGDRYLVKATGGGDFSGQDNRIAQYDTGGWNFYTPKTGWTCYVQDERLLLVWDGNSWEPAFEAPSDITELQDLTLLGVGTTADSSNPLSAKLNNALWVAQTVAEGGSGDLRYVLSKESASKTLSLLFQDNFSGRAEIGLAGDDDFHFKTSPDGSAWNDALILGKTTGSAKINAGFFLTGGISPAQITADQNDYAPTGLPAASVLRLSSDASRAVTGLSGGGDGRVIAVLNVGANDIVLKDASASSAADNRFDFGADLTIATKKAALLWYDAADSRWRQWSSLGDVGSGAGGTVTSVAVSVSGAGLSVSGSPVTSSGTIALTVDSELAALAGLTSAADKLPYFTGSGTAAVADFTSAGRALVDDADAAAQRTTLGLGTAATQDYGTSANNLVRLDGSARLPAVDGSQLTGIGGGGTVTSVGVAVSGTGLSVSGSPVTSSGNITLTVDAELAALAGLTSAADKLPYFTGSGTAALADLTSTARSLLDDSSASSMRTTLGLAIGSDVQGYDVELAALAGLTSAADKVPYFTGAGTAAAADFTSAGRALVDDADATAQRTTLGLGTAATQNYGTSANNLVRLDGSARLPAVDGSQLTGLAGGGSVTSVGISVSGAGLSVSGSPVTSSGSITLTVDAELAALAGLTSAADKVPYFTGSGTAAVADFTSAGRALVDDANAAAQRTTLGLGTAATQDYGTSANNLVRLDGSARLPAVDGSQLTGISGGGGAAYSLIASHTVSGAAEATISFTGLTASDVIIEFAGAKANTGTNTLVFALSTDNSTYGNATNFGAASSFGSSLNYGAGFITGLRLGYGSFVGPLTSTNTPTSTPRLNTSTSGQTGSFHTTAPITAIQFSLSSNSFDTGSVLNLYGR